jgi:hypothetical protein
MPGRDRPRTLLGDPYDRPWPVAANNTTGSPDAARAEEKIVGRLRRALLAPSRTKRFIPRRIYK